MTFNLHVNYPVDPVNIDLMHEKDLIWQPQEKFTHVSEPKAGTILHHAVMIRIKSLFFFFCNAASVSRQAFKLQDKTI